MKPTATHLMTKRKKPNSLKEKKASKDVLRVRVFTRGRIAKLI